MIVTHEVTIDLLERKSVPQIEATQFDRYTRDVKVTLLAGGEPWMIPEDVSVVMRYSCSDGSGGEYDTMPDGSPCCSREENRLTLFLAPQVLAVPGVALLSATMYSMEKAISVFRIGIHVHPMVQSDQTGGAPYCNVTGFLPAPASAAEGDILRVAQVDESGRVLAVVGVDAVLPGEVEPEESDIPILFFGDSLPQSKSDVVMPFRYVSKYRDISGWCRTRAQGNSSMNYPKKNQTVRLYADPDCSEKLKMDFRGWGEQHKFCLKANWIDLTHARNVVSARLWGDVVRSREGYEALHDRFRSSPNQGAVDGFPVMVFAGGIYQGRYTLNIPKDPWMAAMDASREEHCILCGENYVSGCFRAEAKIDGSDWSDEVHDSVPDLIRIMWNHAIDFVRNSTDEEFRADIERYFYLDSLIDYHLFGLLSCGLDAYGKNQLFMTYNSVKWLAGMYDMDATWGLWWNGGKFVDKDYDRTEYQDFADGEGNLLYIRLEQCFYQEIQARWEQLRNGALSVDNILLRFQRFVDIAPETLVKEDYASTTANGACTGIPLKTSNNIQQIREFVVYRHGWCDDYVAALGVKEVIPCTGISFAYSAYAITEGASETLPCTVTPENCTEPVIWSSDNSRIVSVENGTITAQAVGSAVITVSCGAYSDTISVEVLSGSVNVNTCTGISLSETSVTLTGAVKHKLTATVTPSDCTEPIIWESGSPETATVDDDGVVTSMGEGLAIITATCGSKSATCMVNVQGMVDNLLAGIGWHVGEVNSSTGEISQTATAANYTDLIDISEFADTFMEMNCDCTTSWSRMILYDADMNVISSFQATGVGRIPSDAKYARFSIYNGAGKTLEILGDRFNFWDGEIMNGSYANSQYNPNDDPSCFVRCVVSPGENLMATGGWGMAFLNSEYEVINLSLIPKLENKKITVPDGAEYAAHCAEDTWVDRCFCNRMNSVGFGAIE